MNEVSRRRFLKATAAAATGGVAVSGCSENQDPYALVKPVVPGSEDKKRGEEQWIRSTCAHCFSGCGIRVRVVEGRVVNIEGNPDCPVNEGALGPKGHVGAHVLYHPDRVRQPLKRDGQRGSGRWTPISWDDAIQEIGDRLRKIREEGEPRGLIVVDGEPRGLMPRLWNRFLAAYGSPNHVNHRSTTEGGIALAMAYMQGVHELPAYDFANTTFILVFGENLLEGSCQIVAQIMKDGASQSGKRVRPLRLVQVSPGFSVTAAKADQWVPIEPGTYGALALGLAHVLITEELYDKAFVQEHTFGFEDWTDDAGQEHRGFRDFVLKEYALAEVSRVTKVPEHVIRQLAREMAASRPAIALADLAGTATTNGLGAAMAIHALNALLGNLERRGGVFVQRPVPLTPWSTIEPDQLAQEQAAAVRLDGAGTIRCPLGTGFLQGLPEAILAGEPYPAQALFLYYSNPVYSKPEGKRWIEAIRKIPLVVSFSPLPDESTFWADFVLPDHTYLERWELVEPAPSTAFPIVCLRQPAVEPRHDTMATGDALLAIAKVIGSPVSEALPWSDYRTAAQERLKGLAASQSASIKADDVSDLIVKLGEVGVWSEKPVGIEQWETAFQTKSGKFEFYSQGIAERLAEVFSDLEYQELFLSKAQVVTRGDALCLPHWEPPQFVGAADEYPFVAVAYRGIAYAEGGPRHLPVLLELPEAAHGGGWNRHVEIHPDDAAIVGIDNGDVVWLESPVGKTKLIVQLLPETHHGTVGLHLGHGQWPPPRSEAAVDATVYGLLANANDPLAGIFALLGTRVRIVKES